MNKAKSQILNSRFQKRFVLLSGAVILLVIGIWSFGFMQVAMAATNIDATDKWAWSDTAGWINFYSTNTVTVTSTIIQGYAIFENLTNGYVALDCATSPNGDICATSNFKVNNDGDGNLAGWGWNDTYGWVSFCGNASGGSTLSSSTWVCPSSPTYQVIIDPTTGDFSGWAWNDVIGWISFNCNNSGIGNTCGTSNYKVNTLWRGIILPVTGWLESSTYDTGIPEGAAFNAVMWQGTVGSGGTTIVKFQIATANCSNGATDPPTCTTNAGWGGSKVSGDGAFIGSDGTSAAYYQPGGPGVPVALSTLYHNNKRYFRYRVFLERDAAATTPVVQDIIINWSP
ncbi:MAG: hypothetical protein WD889_02330 [Candidatus Colwellbacteria bacterium]